MNQCSQRSARNSADQLGSPLIKPVYLHSSRLHDRDNAEFAQLLGQLKDGYEALPAWRTRPKDSILVEHEASQLTQPNLDVRQGRRSIFVTADSQLRRVLQQEARLHSLAGCTVSQLGLVALVDVMVGVEPDERSFARLLWARIPNDEQKAVMDYFIGMALRKYDEAMTMEMQNVAAQVASEVVEEAAKDEVDLLGKEREDVARTAKFLDRYEDRFFERMREVIERREKQDRAPS